MLQDEADLVLLLVLGVSFMFCTEVLLRQNLPATPSCSVYSSIMHAIEHVRTNLLQDKTRKISANVRCTGAK